MDQQLFVSEFNQSKTSFKKRLQTNRNQIFVVNTVSKLYYELDNIVNEVRKNPEIRFDCKEGCVYCCSLRVEVLPPEAFYVAGQIKKLKKFDKNTFIAGLEKQAAYAKGKTKEEYYYPCTFLNNGSCSIYQNRPFMCRKLLSFDVEECKTEAREPTESVELYSRSQGLGLGFAEVYTHYKYQSEPTEFSQALLKVLTNDNLLKKWFKGGIVFDPLP